MTAHLQAEPRWSQVGKVVLVLLLWQLAFWGVVHLAERAAQPRNMDPRSVVDYQFIDQTSLQDAPTFQARRNNVRFDVLEKNSAPRIRFILPFEVEDPKQPIALYLSVRNSIDRVRVNGHVSQTASEIPRLKGLVSAEPAYIGIPGEQLRVGRNTLIVETPNTGDQWLSEFAIGRADSLATAFHWKRFLQTDIALAGLAMIVFAILLCLVVRWPKEDRMRAATLIALLAVCGGSTLLLTFTPPFGLNSIHIAFLFALFSFWMALAIIAYVMVDARSPGYLTRYLRGLGVAVIVSMLVVAGAYWLATRRGPLGDITKYTILVSFDAVVLSVVFALIALAFATIRDRGTRWFERSLIAFCIAAFGLDRLSTVVELYSPFDSSLKITMGWSNIVGALLGLSVVVAIAREASEARRVVVTANETLRAKLAEREAELSESYAREGEVQKRSVLLSERQRLLRDMHDGIGGQLVSLQMRLRNQSVEREEIEFAVNDSLNDLRLIVDALDDAELDLSDALLHFERRVRDQLKSSGIEFESIEQFAPEQGQNRPTLGPKATLQVLRILQEGISNAVRHAKPSKIRLRSMLGHERIEIELQDDGVGMAPTSPGGHGLNNMHARARNLGGELTIAAAEREFSGDSVGCKLSLILNPQRLGMAGIA